MSKDMTATVEHKKEPVTKTDPKVDAAAREKLVTARIGLLLKAPFFGTIATRLELVNADEWLPTLATNGKKFYYNSEFVNKMPLKQMEFGFGHEVLHVVYDHIGLEGRLGERDPKIWNIACDFCVNQDLVDQRVGEKITQIQILFDPKYKGMSAEEVYDDLMKNANKMDINEMMKRMVDQHIDGENDPDSMTESERKALRDEIKEAVLSAAQAVGAGNVPAGIKKMLDALCNPKMDWRELLQQQIESIFNSDYSWARPSRKGWDSDAIMPGMKKGQAIDVCVSVDMSGSTAEWVKDFFTEVKGIMEQYDEYRLHLWTFDTEVYNPVVFTSDNMEDILNYVPQGGGGTTFECNWEYMKENQIEPKRFIMFTDGCPCGGWGDPDYCDTVWIIYGSTTIVPPYGIHAYYDEVAKKAAGK